MRIFVAILTTLALARPGTAAAQVVIDTRTGGTQTTVPFGQVGDVPGNLLDDDKNGLIDEPGTLQRNHTVGQTFTVPPTAQKLTAFSLTTRDSHFEDGVGVIETPTNFRSYVMAWDGANNRATGPVLFQSGVQATTEDGADHTAASSGLTLSLPPGGTYVAFVTQEGFGMPSGNNIFSNVLARDSTPGGTYAGGTLVTKTDGTLSFTGLTTESWTVAADTDAEFFASFTTVPEPGSLMLVAPVTIGWVTYWRRRWQISAIVPNEGEPSVHI
jgi:hypothetical protein